MKNEIERVKPSVLLADLHTLNGVKSIPGYAPANAEYTVNRVQEIADMMTTAQINERKFKESLASARNDTILNEWAFHEAAVGVKAQVVAQYGVNSTEAETVGRKTRKSRARHAVATAMATTPGVTPVTPPSVAPVASAPVTEVPHA